MERDVFRLMSKAVKTANPPHAVIADSKLFRPENSNKPDEISICRRSPFRIEFDHIMRDRRGPVISSCNRRQIFTESAGTVATI